MSVRRPSQVIVIGFFLVLFGFATPLLMVIDVIQPSFVLAFLAHASSVAGLVLGVVAASAIVRASRD